jgi:polar amino acid transport system substrate-binding protein
LRLPELVSEEIPMSEQTPGTPGEPGATPPTPPPSPDEVPTAPVPTPPPTTTPPASTDGGGGSRNALIVGAAVLVLVIIGAFLLLNQGGGGSPAATASASAPASEEPSEAQSEAPSEEPTEAPSPSPTLDACAPENLATITAGTLTIGADNPAYPPYFEPSDQNPDPWELGDPTNQMGFEGAVAYAIATEMGYAPDQVTWVVTPFNNAIQPGPKDFDLYLSQVSYSDERAQAVDLSDGYYDVAQSVVALEGSDLSKVTTISGLKDFVFGAQVGTTSYQLIQDVIAPSKEAKVYDTNDAAVEALGNGQIDGLVVDLPTAFYVTAAQVDNGVIVGQFPQVTGASEHFSAVLDKGSSLTSCVNAAIGRLKDSGQLASITQEWLSDKANAPVFQP